MQGNVFSRAHVKRQQGLQEGVALQTPSEELHWLHGQMAPRISSCGGSDTVGMKRRPSQAVSDERRRGRQADGKAR